MRTLFASVVLLAAITSSCDSETVTSNIQTTSESVASSVGEAEIVRAGGTLKLSASAELRIPLHGVTAELTLESSITTSPSSEEFGIVAGTSNTRAPFHFNGQRASVSPHQRIPNALASSGALPQAMNGSVSHQPYSQLTQTVMASSIAASSLHGCYRQASSRQFATPAMLAHAAMESPVVSPRALSAKAHI